MAASRYREDPQKRRVRRLAWIERTRDLLRSRYNHRCSYPGCGSFFKLEFAHVKPTGLCSRGRGRIERLLDVLKNPDCYTLMCKYCHKKYDSEQWKRRQQELEARIAAAVESAYREEVPF